MHPATAGQTDQIALGSWRTSHDCWNERGYPQGPDEEGVDLSPCLKAGDSWAEHSGPGMLARRQNAVTGLHVHWALGCRPRSTAEDSHSPCAMQAMNDT